MPLFSIVRSIRCPGGLARSGATAVVAVFGSLFLFLHAGWAQQSDHLRLGPANADLKAHSSADTAIEDINGDGHPDLVMAGRETTPLYLGTGNGSFEPVGAGLDGCGDDCALSIADVNGDDSPDLLINGTLYLGDGAGGFDKANADLSEVRDAANAIGDVNGDGHLDILIAGENADEEPTAALYLGGGDGTFEAAGADLSGIESGNAAIEDLDADGHPDLLISGDDGAEVAATLYLGDGTGSFSRADTDLEGCRRGGCAIALGDVNGDDRPDLLLNDILHIGAGGGRFEVKPIEEDGLFPDLPNASFSSLIGDVDGDGHADVLMYASAHVPAQGQVQHVKLYLGNGTGTFSEADVRLHGLEAPFSTADVDGDGSLDLLGGSTLYLGGGQAGFLPSEEPYYVDRALTREDLRGLGLRTLALLRNTIYAKGGHDFSTDWLAEHFRTRYWYDPSGFDAEAVSERDLQNAKLIKAFEEDLTLDQLLLRRALHWEPYGRSPPTDWNPPGPFDKDEEVREARLLEEAIAERREAGAEPSETSIPKGFGDTFVLGASLSTLPDSIYRPGDGAQYFSDRVAPNPTGTAETLPHGKILGGRTDDNGRIEHVYTGPLSVQSLGDVPTTSMNNTGLLRILSSFGEPTAYGQWEDYDPTEAGSPYGKVMRWEGETRTAELHRFRGPSSSVIRRFLLRTNDPSRLCGPEDGFEAWFGEFKAALASGAPNRIAEYIQTPFEGTVLDEYAGASLDDELEKEDGKEPVPIAEEASPSCEPTRASRGGYRVPTVVEGADYIVQRIDGEWKATRID